MFAADQTIGPYTLGRRIGRGGFGEVWLAERRSQFFTKRLAIKLPHDDQVDIETIQNEAVLWEQASGHPNVLPIIDADVYDGQVVIASEFAEGGSLADKLKAEGKMSVSAACKMAIGVLNGLEFLHQRKIIHRDVKPQNILLQGSTPRLADFGISRAIQTAANSAIVAGTDAYMSPESFEGKRTPQTDLWSVGVVLFELVSGSLPFPQEHPSERMYAILTRPPLDLESIMPPMLRSVIGKALEKDTAKRYATAGEFREHLEWILTDLSQPNRSDAEKTAVLENFEIPTFAPQSAPPTQLVVPIVPDRKDKPIDVGFLDSYSDEPEDIEPRSGPSIGVIAAIILGGILAVSILYSLLSDGSARSVSNTTPTPSQTPRSTPTASASSSPTPTPTSTPIPWADRIGKYSGNNGTVEILKSDSRSITFEMRVGTGKGGSGELDGTAIWQDPNNAVHTSIADQDNYNDPSSPWYQKKCTVTFKFVGTTLKTTEVSGCLFYHGAGATLSGTFAKK